MPTSKDFCRTWIFKSDPSVQRAYPDGGKLDIGVQFDERGEKFMLAWTDMDTVLHVLTGLTLDGSGHLVADECQDLATAWKWTIRIAYNSATADEPPTIRGEVYPASGGSEGDLSGNWGAEAPPRDGDGQPS